MVRVRVTHYISLIGRHESNGMEHVNALLLGHLRRLDNDERLVYRCASDIMLPLPSLIMLWPPQPTQIPVAGEVDSKAVRWCVQARDRLIDI